MDLLLILCEKWTFLQSAVSTSLHSSFLLQKCTSQEIFEFQCRHIWGFCHIPCSDWPLPWPQDFLLESRCQELSSSDFWHQPSLNTFHCVAFSWISIFPVSVFNLTFLFLRTLFHLLFPFVFLLSDLAHSWSWFRHGRDQMISAGKTAFSLHIALNPVLSSCLFYSNTLKQ